MKVKTATKHHYELQNSALALLQGRFVGAHTNKAKIDSLEGPGRLEMTKRQNKLK